MERDGKGRNMLVLSYIVSEGNILDIHTCLTLLGGSIEQFNAFITGSHKVCCGKCIVYSVDYTVVCVWVCVCVCVCVCTVVCVWVCVKCRYLIQRHCSVVPLFSWSIQRGIVNIALRRFIIVHPSFEISVLSIA